mmetsp:Transcript_28985/g.33365  ORF Transcript_28985/g.33365 Transcript_28985/m.33365 type:complete len:201 (+) Transcript_28985:1-603(+)
MTQSETVDHYFLHVAKEMNNRAAIKEYARPPVHFSSFFIDKYCRRGVFDKYQAFKTWSRWDALLCAAPVPVLDHIFFTNKEENDTIRSDISTNAGYFSKGGFFPQPESPIISKVTEFANYLPTRNGGKSYKNRWIDKILFVSYFRTLHTAIEDRDLIRFLFQMVDGIIEWISYLSQGLFPFVIIFFIAAVFSCDLQTYIL